MIVLDSTLKTLEIVLSGAVTTNQLPFVAVYVDVTTTAYTPIENDGASNNTTAVTMVAAPAASTQRQIKFLSVQNEDTVNATVILQYNDNGTTRRISKFTLNPDDTLLYTDGEGMRVLDSTGSLKQSLSGSPVSSISIASANGFAGSSSGGTTPILTLTTSISGLLKGNGTAISAATASDVTGQLLTGYVSGAGVLAATDTILQAFNKLNGNIAALVTGVSSVSGTTNRITSTGGSTPVIDISASYVGQSSITTLGTIGTGTWQGTTIGKAYGGTGVNIGTTALTLGTSSSNVGKLTFANATNAFTQSFQATVVSADITYNLPATAPTAGQVLQSTAPSAGVATLSWATASSGITVGTTTITSGTSTRVAFNDGGVYGESADLLFNKTTTVLTVGDSAGGSSTIDEGTLILGGQTALKIKALGYGSSIAIGTSTTQNSYGAIAIGYNSTAGASGVAIGGWSWEAGGVGAQAGSDAIAIGSQQYGSAKATGTGSIGIGPRAYITHNYSIGFGFAVTSTATNQLIFGNSDYLTQGVLSGGVYFNGVTSTTPYSVVINACGGSGTNVGGASLTLAGGKGTGNAAGGNIVFQTSNAGSSGSTLQSLTDKLTIYSDGRLYSVVNGGYGTSIGLRQITGGTANLSIGSGALGTMTGSYNVTVGDNAGLDGGAGSS